jgi:hypothetical protein
MSDDYASALPRGCGCVAAVLVLILIACVFLLGRCSATNGVKFQSPIKVESKGTPDGK